VITDLNKLGLQKQAFIDFNKAIRKPSGIVIITGPTGSGKSTTLVAALYTWWTHL
jgi:type IV pilus assembly protein PilB